MILTKSEKNSLKQKEPYYPDFKTVPIGQQLDQRIAIRVTHKQHAAYKKAARIAGITLADWVRSAIAEKLERDETT